MTAPSHRWSFSLRMLFVVLAMLGVCLSYELNWIRQRHAFLSAHQSQEWRSYPAELPQAPGMLWLFGESGLDSLNIIVEDGPSGDYELRRARQLFPEATIGCLSRH